MTVSLCLGVVFALSGCRYFSPFVYVGGDSCTIDPRNTPVKLCEVVETERQKRGWGYTDAEAKLMRKQALAECKGIDWKIRDGFHPEKGLYCD
ncbi:MULTISPECIES: hypothetical protein [unclassified Janthinobacterium]|uniref:hypothetical protein n=1 Tax=unclassified Janthinobacterium TaxID=2610881 RepID=UPI0012FB7E36|nr:MULTISPECIES: hypothetical protein [unclassified Janthinobacterium]MEC5160587.1 hypothetical protein [Janthinobacterium sp. CG_S6]